MEEANRLVTDETANFEPSNSCLCVSASGKLNLGIGHIAEINFVRVAKRLAMTHKNDPFRAISPPVALLPAVQKPTI
jgi:hypothetical protein